MNSELRLQSTDEARVLLGPLDRTAKLLRKSFDVSLVHRGDVIRILGEEENVAHARQILEQALKKLRKGYPVSHAEVERWILQREDDSPDAKRGGSERSDSGSRSPITRGSGSGSNASVGPKRLSSVKAKTFGQQKYLEALEKNQVVFGVGPAGTGKTFLAVAAGVRALRDGEVKKLVLTRPAVEAGEKLGFLPGDFQAKVHPYLRPLYDSIEDLLEPGTVRKYFENELIEVCPLAFMRGRTLNNSYIILDEAQNTTISQMRMFLTRMGVGSRVVVTGDSTQVGLPKQEPSGLVDAVQRLDRVTGLEVVRLAKEDIVRHSIVQEIVEAYEVTQNQMPSPEDRLANPVRGGKKRR